MVMRRTPYFVSLHQHIRLDENLPSIGAWDEHAEALIRGATGVLMPKYFTPSRYRRIRELARAHFPSYDVRYAYRGKASQIELFRRHGYPHPETRIFGSPGEAEASLAATGMPRPLPFVLKGDLGGGGSAVFPVESRQAYLEGLDRLPPNQPVLVQEWVEAGGKDLRVVFMADQECSYFRVGGESFYNNVSKGARIEPELEPARQRSGRRLARRLAEEIGIDLAAFDVIFPVSGPPQLLEINFLFGKKGLGGLRGYNRMFEKAVQGWKRRLLSAATGCP